jgi:hypothetical protein
VVIGIENPQKLSLGQFKLAPILGGFTHRHQQLAPIQAGGIHVRHHPAFDSLMQAGAEKAASTQVEGEETINIIKVLGN